MQGFAQASENPPARKQWRTMEKTMRRAIQQSEIQRDVDVRREAADTLARASSRPRKKPADEQGRVTTRRNPRLEFQPIRFCAQRQAREISTPLIPQGPRLRRAVAAPCGCRTLPCSGRVDCGREAPAVGVGCLRKHGHPTPDRISLRSMRSDPPLAGEGKAGRAHPRRLLLRRTPRIANSCP